MAQKGFEYEEKAYKALEKYDISTGGVAGASHDKPDLTIQNSKKDKTGCELKISPTAAGSLVMKYFDGKWSYGEFKQTEIEKAFLHDLGEEFNLLTEMNDRGNAGKNWRDKIPMLQNDKQGKKILIPGMKDKRVAYKVDLENFGAKNEVHIKIPAKAICDYYIKKKCSYINVGTHGFYTLNDKDDLDLNKKLKVMNEPSIPNFAKSAEAEIRVRCQYKGGGDYQFVMTLEFRKMTKSPYNLAPLRTGSKSEIDINKLEKDPILAAFK